MTWACEFTEEAKEDFRSLPKAIQKRVSRVVTQMASDPFQGDIKALKGEEWHGVSAVELATTASSSLSSVATRQLLSIRSRFDPARPTDDVFGFGRVPFSRIRASVKESHHVRRHLILRFGIGRRCS